MAETTAPETLADRIRRHLMNSRAVTMHADHPDVLLTEAEIEIRVQAGVITALEVSLREADRAKEIAERDCALMKDRAEGWRKEADQHLDAQAEQVAKRKAVEAERDALRMQALDALKKMEAAGTIVAAARDHWWPDRGVPRDPGEMALVNALAAAFPGTCSNCGGSLETACIAGGEADPDEGFCSDACYEQHLAEDCPLEHGDSYRSKPSGEAS